MGNIHFPDNFSEAKKYPALVLATPGSSVKEQIGAVYAKKMAEKGFVALPSIHLIREQVAESRVTWKILRLAPRISAVRWIFW